MQRPGPSSLEKYTVLKRSTNEWMSPPIHQRRVQANQRPPALQMRELDCQHAAQCHISTPESKWKTCKTGGVGDARKPPHFSWHHIIRGITHRCRLPDQRVGSLDLQQPYPPDSRVPPCAAYPQIRPLAILQHRTKGHRKHPTRTAGQLRTHVSGFPISGSSTRPSSPMGWSVQGTDTDTAVGGVLFFCQFLSSPRVITRLVHYSIMSYVNGMLSRRQNSNSTRKLEREAAGPLRSHDCRGPRSASMHPHAFFQTGSTFWKLEGNSASRPT
jgi:hypothetical protein